MNEFDGIHGVGKGISEGGSGAINNGMNGP